MSRLTLAESAAPSAPSSGKVNVYTSNDPSPVLRFQDDGGNIQTQLGAYVITQASDFTGTDVNTAQPVFNASTNGTITLPSDTSYLLRGAYHIHTTGTTSHTLATLFGGTATLTSIGYQVQASNAATEVLGAVSVIWSSVATATVVSSALASATHHSILLTGIVRVNAGGTFIPQYQWSSAPGVAGVTLANSHLMLIPFGSKTATTAGGVWS